ncbi:MAG TPA: PAS domain S-box protein, partial [Candidatus Wallbacteria bacterium]|nr:PAS domain S-box protein [Candidatus Wallbacteria bacterium]
MQYNKNILLVDDDITLIKILKNQLQSLDYIVHTAFNGAEALDLIFNKNIQIDIIIMDIVLGKDPDGIETAHKILEKINIPIIFHSAHSEKSIIEKIETITSYGFISKTSGITGMDASIKTAFKLFESNRMLAESRNHINAIINSTTDFIWSVDTATYKILSFNDSLYNFFLCTGVTLKTGMSHLDLFSDEEYRRNWDYYYRQAIEQGYFKCEYQTFYGSRTLDLRINAIKIDNKISYLSIFAKDITENKKLENLLKKSEEKFSKMFMLSPVAMSINDFTDKNRIIECNNAFSEHTGYSHDEVIGKTSADLNLYSDPDMRSKVIDLINKYHKITNFEYCLRRKNGDTRQGLLSADVVDINEKPCIIASSVDITERIEIENKLKDSEAKFSSAFENAAIGMALLSPQGKWLKVNKATCELLGYSQEELLS